MVKLGLTGFLMILGTQLGAETSNKDEYDIGEICEYNVIHV